MKFTKEDLRLSDYNWTMIGVDQAENATLNRKEGYEVLLFINHFMSEYGLVKPHSFHKLEKMIRNAVPEGLQKKTDITQWLLKNWQHH